MAKAFSFLVCLLFANLSRTCVFSEVRINEGFKCFLFSFSTHGSIYALVCFSGNCFNFNFNVETFLLANMDYYFTIHFVYI